MRTHRRTFRGVSLPATELREAAAPARVAAGQRRGGPRRAALRWSFFRAEVSFRGNRWIFLVDEKNDQAGPVDAKNHQVGPVGEKTPPGKYQGSPSIFGPKQPKRTPMVSRLPQSPTLRKPPTVRTFGCAVV